jgi:hypothetical protein
MKKLLSIVALTALVAGIPSASFAVKKETKPAATPAAATPAPATPAAVKPIPLHSQVATIDAAGKSFTHKNKDGKEVKFVLTDKTEVKQGKADAKFEDIKVGDWVSGLRLKKSDTEWEVLKITKFGPLEKTAEKKPEATGKPAEKPAEKK